jgi:ribosomal protein S19E (S16A)
MQTDFDHELTSDQWNTLRALRPTAPPAARLNRFVLEQLSLLELVALSENGSVLTSKGRAVVLRGSPRLWDLAA